MPPDGGNEDAMLRPEGVAAWQYSEGDALTLLDGTRPQRERALQGVALSSVRFPPHG